jgi:hypothetical protein
MTLADKITENKNTVAAFNKPYQTVVAINTINIGDDNDYSCFLARATYELWVAGNVETAYRLYSTDPMLNDFPTMEMFLEAMESKKKFKDEEAENASSTWKHYTVD